MQLLLKTLMAIASLLWQTNGTPFPQDNGRFHATSNPQPVVPIIPPGQPSAMGQDGKTIDGVGISQTDPAPIFNSSVDLNSSSSIENFSNNSLSRVPTDAPGITGNSSRLPPKPVMIPIPGWYRTPEFAKERDWAKRYQHWVKLESVKQENSHWDKAFKSPHCIPNHKGLDDSWWEGAWYCFDYLYNQMRDKACGIRQDRDRVEFCRKGPVYVHGYNIDIMLDHNRVPCQAAAIPVYWALTQCDSASARGVVPYVDEQAGIPLIGVKIWDTIIDKMEIYKDESLPF